MKKILTLSLLLSLTLVGCTRAAAPFDEFAQCLTDNGAVMYGSATCPHCKAQKADFKGSFDLVNYVECTQNQSECQAAGVSAVPAWDINGERHEGRMSLSTIADLSGCELDVSTPGENAGPETE